MGDTCYCEHIAVNNQVKEITSRFDEINIVTNPSRDIADNGEVKWIKHYSNKHKILLVGEGDFSFALCLAKAFGSASSMVATSLDSKATLLMHYSKAGENLLELEQRGSTVVHGVNAHTMSQHPDLMLKRFDRIVFNFPHAGFYHIEFRDRQIKIHQKLVKGFFKSVKQMLTNIGEVHVTHKTAYPFSEWEVVELAAEVGLQLLEKARFFISYYKGYHNKRGSGDHRDRSFPVGECTTFKFILDCSNKINRRNNILDISGDSKWIKHYSNKHKILLVGEGDFSFAVSLARAFGSGPNMVATSLDSRVSLLMHYSKASQNLEELEQRGCTVVHGVNAHTLSKNPAIMVKQFDRIVFNFPHAGFYYDEHQYEQIKIHRKLLKGFFINAKNMLSDVGGEVHVTHKTSHPYREWKVEEMAEVVGLQLVEEALFSQSDYNGYCIKRGGGNHWDKIYRPVEVYSTTFKFILSPTAGRKKKNKNTIC